MVTEIAQKSYKTLFPLRYFKKKDAEERLIALERILILKQRKR